MRQCIMVFTPRKPSTDAGVKKETNPKLPSIRFLDAKCAPSVSVCDNLPLPTPLHLCQARLPGPWKGQKGVGTKAFPPICLSETRTQLSTRRLMGYTAS
jgi:hypothetical protein